MCETESFQEDYWFGRACQNKLLNWIFSNIPTSSIILDVGCGDGSFLAALLEKKYPNIVGIDYSNYAIKLCKARFGDIIKVEQVDILKNSSNSLLNGFDVVFDKGTWDAISLNPDISFDDLIRSYKTFVKNVMKKFSSKFILTSCNWTSSELLNLFNDFVFIEEITHKSFKFGSSTGSDVTTIVFGNLR